ncbi:MAG TPA: S41 family peptidase [Thermoleophilaceae bacterium]|nr:S41 family peptidase [Thermoleophilaceae bacterium]
MRPLYKLIATIAAVVAALCAGMFLGGNPEHLPTELREIFVEDERAVRAEIIDSIKDGFYKEVDEDALDQASYKGIVRELGDRFSHYLTPEEAQLFSQSVSGRFEGVGMTVQEHPRGLLVVSVFEGSPAEKAGIRKDDVITHVDGESIAGEPTDVSTAKIKGKPGTTVELTVLPAGDRDRRREVEVERASIEIPIVQSRMRRAGGKRVGYARLLSFTSGAHGELREKLDRLIEDGAEGIVLDLRGNGGGLLRESVLVSSIFIEDGTIVSTKGRKRPEREFEAEGEAISKELPVVVLVDRGTASASEIVSGALRDTKRGTLVGEKTFGKGVFQELEPLSNGGALDLTVGSYYLPSGENISQTGITPAVKARDLPRTRRDEALPVALEKLAEKL